MTPWIQEGARALETSRKALRVDRREIAFVKFIFEAYDGIAVLRTVDPAAGIIILDVAPGCEDVVGRLLADLGREIMIEDCPPTF